MAFEEGAQRDLALHARELRAEAEVGPAGEREVLLRVRPRDVEACPGRRRRAGRGWRPRAPSPRGRPRPRPCRRPRWSRLARRAVRSTGGSKRRISSTAFGQQVGLRDEPSRCSGWAKSCAVPLPMRFTVVSNPAASTQQRGGRPAPARTGPRRRRRPRRRGSRAGRPRARAAAGAGARASTSCSAARLASMLRVRPPGQPHVERRWPRRRPSSGTARASRSGTPSISQMTVTGSRLA